MYLSYIRCCVPICLTFVSQLIQTKKYILDYTFRNLYLTTTNELIGLAGFILQLHTNHKLNGVGSKQAAGFYINNLMFHFTFLAVKVYCFNTKGFFMSYKLLPLITVSLSLVAPIQAAELSQHLVTRVEPEPIKRVSPKYPISAARNHREGWARLSFVIDTEGNVNNILVTETSGSKDLTKAAVKAAQQWKYKPAMENGKPVQQCVNSVQMDFRMNKNGTTGATRKFIHKYKKAQQALTDKDFAELEKQLASMKKNKYMHLSENNYFHLLSADYAKELGQKGKQLSHLSRVAMSLVTMKNEKQKLSVLYQVFSLQIELNKFKAAHATYEKLIKLPSAKPYLEQLSDVIARVDGVIAGDKNLVLNGAINKDFWTTNLVRNEFSLIGIEGSLHTLDVRCANKRHVYTIEENNSWKIPTSWENCSIYVFGEEKTSFQLVEHPLSS